MVKSRSILAWMILASACSIAPGAVSIDADGWTVVTPSVDSRIVYVSNSDGSDSNNGLSPSTPKKTITAGNALLRNGYPDHLLLKRGDVFPVEAGNLLGRWKDGRNAQEPMLFSYYGESGERPVVKIDSHVIAHANATRHYQAFIGVDFYRAVADPNSADFDNSPGESAFSLVGGGANFLMEDCRLRFMSIVIQSFGENPPYSDPQFRRNIVLDSWGHDSYIVQAGPQGIFMSGVVGSYVLEENFFDHCGWNEDVTNAGANMYNHNFYIQYSNVAGGIIRGNIISRGSAHGIQARSGGLVDRNLFILNAVSLNMGGVGAPTDPDVYTFPNRAKENVAISGRRMDPSSAAWPRTDAVWGIWHDTYIPGVLIEDNIVANRIQSGTNKGFIEQVHTVMVDNISYSWNAATDTPVDPSWPHPADDIGDYFASIGGSNSTIAYLEWLRDRPLRSLPWEMTAYAGINYIRAGFNKAAVPGYYVYNGAPSSELISDGSFGSSSISDMSHPYIVGTGATDSWLARSGTGGQASYVVNDSGDYYVVAGYGNTNGTFQVIDWPGSGDLEVTFEYRGSPTVRVLGGYTGDEISKFFATNDLVQLDSDPMTTSATWASGNLSTTISGSYDYLVVQFINGDIDNVSVTLD